jgi:hypothetical protein
MMVEWIEEERPDLNPIYGLEEAIVGISERVDAVDSIVYDYGKSIKILMDRDGISYEEAIADLKFLSHHHNSLGGGTDTPTFITLPPIYTCMQKVFDVKSKDLIIQLSAEHIGNDPRHILDTLTSIYPDKRILVIDSAIDVSTISEDTMREYGWVRVPEKS